MNLEPRSGCGAGGFHAHNVLTKSKRQRRWKYRASSKVIDHLASSPARWKEARTDPLAEKITGKPEQLAFDFTLERAFRPLVEEWIDATEHMSNMLKAVKHPAYQQIIGMGKVAPSLIVPLLLRELEQRPDHWFWALKEITKRDPAESEDTFDGAVRAWLRWGRRHNYLTDARP